MLAVVAVAAWGPGAASASAPGLAVVVALALLAAAAALYGPDSVGSLALGAAALAPVACFAGPVTAALFGVGIFALRRAGRRVLRLQRRREEWKRWSLETAAGAGRVLVAVLLASLVWRLAQERWEGADAVERIYAAGLLAALVYVAALPLLELASARPGERRRVVARRAAAGLWLDLVGWLTGLGVAHAVDAIGWPVALLLLAGISLPAIEAARAARLRNRALDKIFELTEVALAGHRIIFRNPDLVGIAEQIQIECRRMFPFSWFEFELAGTNGESRSWQAGPDGLVSEGAPEPPPAPPVLPGVHRRVTWRVVEREIVAQNRVIARLRFWCDPRRLESASLDLFDSLLPQMASSIERALLDREARRDPLTDLPDRRALEDRLERVYEECRLEGGSMSVIMLDLDHFKKINDRFGHKVGDLALLEIAHLLESHRRDTDLCCRYGGEEFAVVLEHTTGQTALQIAERLRRAVEWNIFVVADRKVPLRVSCGIAAYPELHAGSGSELVETADEALYEAKRRGRNRCLLNLGSGRFREPDGTVLGRRNKKAPEPPTLFG